MTWEAGNTLIIPNNEENYINWRYDVYRQICFPTNKATKLLNTQGVLDKPGGQRNSIKRAQSSRLLISSLAFLLLVNSVSLFSLQSLHML